MKTTLKLIGDLIDVCIDISKEADPIISDSTHAKPVDYTPYDKERCVLPAFDGEIAIYNDLNGSQYRTVELELDEINVFVKKISDSAIPTIQISTTITNKWLVRAINMMKAYKQEIITLKHKQQ